MLQPVCLDSLVVEPGTVARLPLVATDHAKFCSTSARHMVAPFLELDHSGAIEASLQAFLFGNLNKHLGGKVFGTFSRRVHFVVASTAYPCAAPLTFSHLTSVLESDVIRLDPFATMTGRAVDTISGSVLLEFPVPRLFELLVE